MGEHRVTRGHHTYLRLAFVRTLAGRFALRLRPGLRGLRARFNATIPALGDIIMMRNVRNHDAHKPQHTAMLHRHHTAVKEKRRMVSPASAQTAGHAQSPASWGIKSSPNH